MRMQLVLFWVTVGLVALGLAWSLAGGLARW